MHSGFLGGGPDAAVTDNQEKLLKPKVRVRVRKAKEALERRVPGGGRNTVKGEVEKVSLKNSSSVEW